jgi:hypothetical protein
MSRDEEARARGRDDDYEELAGALLAAANLSDRETRTLQNYRLDLRRARLPELAEFEKLLLAKRDVMRLLGVLTDEERKKYEAVGRGLAAIHRIRDR